MPRTQIPRFARDDNDWAVSANLKRSKLCFYGMTTKRCGDVACNVSHLPDLLQHLRINIPAADNGYIHGSFWQLVLMK
jgi:hypothetical protein